MNLLSDVNLDEVVFSPDGKSVNLNFIDMYVGEFISMLRCSSVYVFNYQNTFEKDEGFACYVGEVVCKKLTNEDREEALKRVNYSFYSNDRGLSKPESKNLFVLHLEGGEVILDVICGYVELDGVAILDD